MRSDRKHGGLLNGRTLASLGALMLAVCGGPDPGMVSPAAGAHAGGSQRQSLTAAQLAAALRDPSSRVRYEIYQVRSGDTVEDIAARFGVPARQVRRLNDLDAWHQLRAGQSLALMLPTGPAAPAGEASYDLAASAFEPRYARVTAASPIIPEPDVSAAAHPLYIAPAGSQLVVSAEQGECWGVVMIDGSTGWIAKSGVQVSDRTVSTDELDILFKGGRPDIVQEACRYLGTPYRYGGQLPSEVDCSLLVQTAFAAHGIRLPRTATAQYHHGRAVSFAELLPGDRLYFVSRSGQINHTGIYIGNGRFVHASARRGRVAVDMLNDRLYRTRFLGARRS